MQSTGGRFNTRYYLLRSTDVPRQKSRAGYVHHVVVVDEKIIRRDFSLQCSEARKRKTRVRDRFCAGVSPLTLFLVLPLLRIDYWYRASRLYSKDRRRVQHTIIHQHCDCRCVFVTVKWEQGLADQAMLASIEYYSIKRTTLWYKNMKLISRLVEKRCNYVCILPRRMQHSRMDEHLFLCSQ